MHPSAGAPGQSPGQGLSLTRHSIRAPGHLWPVLVCELSPPFARQAVAASPGKDAALGAGGGDPRPGALPAEPVGGRLQKAKHLGLQAWLGQPMWGLDFSRSFFLLQLVADYPFVPGCPACLQEMAASCPLCQKVTPLASAFVPDREHVSATSDPGAHPPPPLWAALPVCRAGGRLGLLHTLAGRSRRGPPRPGAQSPASRLRPSQLSSHVSSFSCLVVRSSLAFHPTVLCFSL